ncbi:helix-turn-helix transcriptional regulator [Parvibaculum sp.]|uniref:ArsR/SmtB family transcription factor n=1 Tax=Parvibaculum sp. TaxID=2024848 RepID=UPI0025CE19E5|nr:metalloregulator ArsR/SmtB family transcription factor [Parvibaculum sp.]
MESTIAALAALAQETRLSIFRALVRAHSPKDGEGGLAAGDIGEALDVPPATLSFHLKEMFHAGLVTSRREGRSIIYKADLATMRNLTEFLLEDCCQGACGVVGNRQRKKECA